MKRLIVGVLCLAISSALGSQVSAAVLMGYWKLDGNADDSSGNGNDGTIYGSLTWISGGGAHFDGSSYIEIPNTSGWNFADGFTLSARIRYTEPQGFHDAFVVSKLIADDPAGYGLGVFSAAYGNEVFVMAQPGNPGQDRLLGGSYMDGEWHDVMGVYDGTGLSLYVDEALVARETSWQYDSFNTANIRIGYYYPGIDNNYFSGDVADVRIYEGAIPEPVALAVWSLLGGVAVWGAGWRQRRAALHLGQSA